MSPVARIIGRVQEVNDEYRRLFLLFSNRRPEDAPFLEELQALAKENPRCTLIPSMSEMDEALARVEPNRGLVALTLFRDKASDFKGRWPVPA